MTVKLVIEEETFNVVSAYAPQVGLGMTEKMRFWKDMDELLRGLPRDQHILLGGDLNGHIGQEVDGYPGIHGGFGFGVRNDEGRMLLDFAMAHELVVVNSFFKKKEEHLITFHSGGHSTQIDYFLVRKGGLKGCKDCKTLPSEMCSSQHRLLVLDTMIKRTAHRRPKNVSPRILWKNLHGTTAEVFKAKVHDEVNAMTNEVMPKNADQLWNVLANTIRETAKATLGMSAGMLGGSKIRRESWWFNDEVRVKISLKQICFKELSKTREGPEEDKTRLEA